MAKRRWATVGDILNKWIDQGYHISHVDGAVLPPNVIDHDVRKQPEKPPLPTSRTLKVWVDKDGTHTKR